MKYLAVGLLFMASLNAFGQFAKKDILLGGYVAATVQRAPESAVFDNKITDFQIAPNVGVLITQNLELGMRLSYATNYSQRKSASSMFETQADYGSLGFYLQRYFPINDKFLFSIKGDMGYWFGKVVTTATNNTTNEVVENERKSSLISFGITPNFTFFPAERWALQASIGNMSYGYEMKERLSILDVNYGAIGLGLFYCFRKR